MPRAKMTSGKQVEMKEDVKDTFPTKTFDLVCHCDEHDPDVCAWDEDGVAFIIKDVARLESQYLPKKFDHSNFQSFVRQLNLYGFRNVSKEKESGDVSSQYITFRNDDFRRGERALVRNIQRSKKGDRSQRKTRQEEELHAVSDALNKRFDGMELEVKALHAKVDALTSKLDRVLDLMLSSQATQIPESDSDSFTMQHKKRRQEGIPQAKKVRNESYADPMDTFPSSLLDRNHPQNLGARESSLVSNDNSGAEPLARNVSPAISDNLRVVMPAEQVSTVTDENETADNEQGLNNDILLEACRSILDGVDDTDAHEENRIPGPQSNQASASNEGNAQASLSMSQAQRAGPTANTDLEFGDLDAFPLSMSIESSSLSADDILAGIPAGDLHNAAVFDRTAPPVRDRGNRRKFSGRQTFLAGITFLSMIAAIAVGVVYAVGNRNDSSQGPPVIRTSDIGSPEAEVVTTLSEEEVVTAQSDKKSSNWEDMNSSGPQPSEDGGVTAQGVSEEPNETGITTAQPPRPETKDDNLFGTLLSLVPTSMLSPTLNPTLSPMPSRAPSVVPTSNRMMVGYSGNSAAPSSAPA
eukprot:CAMPEP_0183301676 /NCGR_PEP_ID=MMETSP0160_2-20130417/7710_1 /TAXON_ID=2839 ORGANISM="Odontella Sinensis, Strain Grunow 1884" /NCGR_SAMPLE_ID=MMETSP0160_2 /ASSEMBLY_ACC=CAM_ASM_000250 /LENGTH=581 /DNA_ID=CAMNT_0025464331 /DNA_START=30 /DNA_END=1772 /DNA_ORIENTATION=-